MEKSINRLRQFREYLHTAEDVTDNLERTLYVYDVVEKIFNQLSNLTRKTPALRRVLEKRILKIKKDIEVPLLTEIREQLEKSQREKAGMESLVKDLFSGLEEEVGAKRLQGETALNRIKCLHFTNLKKYLDKSKARNTRELQERMRADGYEVSRHQIGSALAQDQITKRDHVIKIKTDRGFEYKLRSEVNTPPITSGNNLTPEQKEVSLSSEYETFLASLNLLKGVATIGKIARTMSAPKEEVRKKVEDYQKLGLVDVDQKGRVRIRIYPRYSAEVDELITSFLRDPADRYNSRYIAKILAEKTGRKKEALHGYVLNIARKLHEKGELKPYEKVPYDRSKKRWAEKEKGILIELYNTDRPKISDDVVLVKQLVEKLKNKKLGRSPAGVHTQLVDLQRQGRITDYNVKELEWLKPYTAQAPHPTAAKTKVTLTEYLRDRLSKWNPNEKLKVMELAREVADVTKTKYDSAEVRIYQLMPNYGFHWIGEGVYGLPRTQTKK